MSDESEKRDSTGENRGQACPWWLCFTFDNIFRRLIHNPVKILRPYIKPGMTVLDVGPGMGFFTIPMARMVGDKGKVIAADLQKEMLDGIARRARQAGVQARIRTHQAGPESIGVSEPCDFCLAFWMVHEVQDRARLLKEIAACLKPGGLFLMVEPKLHTSKVDFSRTVEMAGTAGLTVADRPKVSLSYAVLFKKGG